MRITAEAMRRIIVTVLDGWHDGNRESKADQIVARILEEAAGQGILYDFLDLGQSAPLSWDERFMALARFWTELCSKDPTTRVGAVLVGKNQGEVALGYNGFPRGVRDTHERLHCRETKHLLTQHAERNVLDNASFDVRGSTLYSTQIPCTKHGCSLSVISKGVARVVCPPVPDKEPWRTDAEQTVALFTEVGVKLVFLE